MSIQSLIPMKKAIHFGSLAIIGTAGLVLGTVNPAQAACTGTGNTIPGITFGSFTLGESYDIGNGFCFTLNSFAAGFIGSDTLIVNGASSTSAGLSASRPNPGYTGSNSFNYTFFRFANDLVLQSYTGTVASSADITANSTATMSFVGTSPATLTSSAFVAGGVNVSTGPTYTYPSPSLFSETFTASMNVTQGQMNQFSSTTTWGTIPTPPPSSGVPGPLPMMGLAAAFGYSRKLRQKLKSVI